MSDFITREEIKKLSRSQLNDDVVMHLASTIFNMGTYQIISCVYIAIRGNVYTNHIDRIFDDLYIQGRLPNEVRAYIINALVGETPMITKEDGSEAVLII